MDEMQSPQGGKKSLLNSLSPKQIFLFGLVGGFMSLSTLCFLLLLPGLLRGNLDFGSTAGVNVDTVDADSVSDAGNGPKLADVARGVGLDYDKFKSCVESKKYANKIQTDENEAQKAGGQGTPYLIVVGPNGQTVPIKGAYPFEVVDGVIKKMLGQKVTVADLPTAEKLTVRAVDAKNEYVRGNASAKVTLIEYSDFECPFCKRFHATMQQVLAAEGNNVRWVYRQFPLDSLHSKARTEALASECAGEQGKFWEFVDSLFKVTPSNNGMDISL
jgi:protein-disulfide isomerase